LPRISGFYGIVIYMYYGEHSPPHFHAIYGSDEAVVGVRSAKVLAGGLPNRALRLVRMWARLHREELLANWELARKAEPLKSIDSLE
jgi:hypothetical protein